MSDKKNEENENKIKSEVKNKMKEYQKASHVAKDDE